MTMSGNIESRLKRLELEFEKLSQILDLSHTQLEVCYSGNIWEKVRVLECNIAKIKLSIADDLYAWHDISVRK